MPESELRTWRQFFVLYPFDDFHRYHRPAALVSVSMGGGEIADRLDWLAPPPTERTGADLDMFRAARRKNRT